MQQYIIVVGQHYVMLSFDGKTLSLLRQKALTQTNKFFFWNDDDHVNLFAAVVRLNTIDNSTKRQSI